MASTPDQRNNPGRVRLPRDQRRLRRKKRFKRRKQWLLDNAEQAASGGPLVSMYPRFETHAPADSPRRKKHQRRRARHSYLETELRRFLEPGSR